MGHAQLRLLLLLLQTYHPRGGNRRSGCIHPLYQRTLLPWLESGGTCPPGTGVVTVHRMHCTRHTCSPPAALTLRLEYAHAGLTDVKIDKLSVLVGYKAPELPANEYVPAAHTHKHTHAQASRKVPQHSPSLQSVRATSSTRTPITHRKQQVQTWQRQRGQGEPAQVAL